MAQYQLGQVCVRKFGESKCPLHPNNSVVLFCEECSQLVCLSCMTSNDHKGHSFHNLEDIVKNKGNDIFQFINNLNQLFQPKISQKIVHLDKKKSDLEKGKTCLLKDISTAYEKYVQQLKTQKEAMEADVNTLYDKNCKQCDLQKNVMEALNIQLEGYSKQFQQIFYEGSLVEKFDAWQSIPLKEKEANSKLDECDPETFEFVIELHKINQLMKATFGEIKVNQNRKAANRESDAKQTDFTVKKSPKHAQSISNAALFTYKSLNHENVTPIAEDKAWCTSDGNTIYLINKEGAVQKEMSLYSAEIKHLCLHPITGVLYGTFDDKTICTIETTTCTTITTLTCLYEPSLLTVTPGGDIIVGENSSSGHVYRYSSHGQLLQQSKEEYCVSDISYSDINDHVAIACGEDGVRIMDGTLTNVIHTHKVECYTVVYDRDGSLVIGDNDNNSILILDGQTFSTIRTFKHPQMPDPFKPHKIRLYDNSMWVTRSYPDKIVHVMFQ